MRHWFSDVSAFRRDPLALLLDKAKEHSGPFVPLALGPKPVLLLTDPSLVKPVLKADDSIVDKGRLVQKLKPIVGDSSLVLSGEAHGLRRAAVHPHMAKGHMEKLVPAISAEIRATCAEAARAGRFQAHALTAPLTLKLIGLPIFGNRSLSEADQQVIVRAVHSVEDELAEDMFRIAPLSPWRALARRRRRHVAREEIGLVIRRARKAAADFSVIRSLQAFGLDGDALRDEVLTMLIAGHHTTGSAAAWLLYYLATEPGLAENLAREAATAVGAGGEYDTGSLRHAHLSQTVVKELLRLFPSAWWFSREVRQETEFGGQTLRPGTSILISPWQLHRDPAHWPDPETFRLDRDYAASAYVPFGVGPRACVGMGAALLELQLLALEMASAFHLKLAEPVALSPRASVTLLPPPMEILVRPRRVAAIRAVHPPRLRPVAAVVQPPRQRQEAQAAQPGR